MTPESASNERQIQDEQRRLDTLDGKADLTVEGRDGAGPEQVAERTRTYIGRVNAVQARVRELRRKAETGKDTQNPQWPALEKACDDVEEQLAQKLAGVNAENLQASVPGFNASVDRFLESLAAENAGEVRASAAGRTDIVALRQRSDRDAEVLGEALKGNDRLAVVEAAGAIIRSNEAELASLKAGIPPAAWPPEWGTVEARIAAIEAALPGYRATRLQALRGLAKDNATVQRLCERSDRAWEAFGKAKHAGDRQVIVQTADALIGANEEELEFLRGYPNPAERNAKTGETVASRIGRIETMLPSYRADRAVARGEQAEAQRRRLPTRDDWLTNASRVRERLTNEPFNNDAAPAVELARALARSPQLATYAVAVIGDGGGKDGAGVTLSIEPAGPSDRAALWTAHTDKWGFVILRNVADPDTFIAVPQARLLGGSPPKANVRALQEAARQAKEWRKSEREDPAGIAAIDLPKDRPIGVLCVADANDAHTLKHRSFLDAWPAAMARRYKVVRAAGADGDRTQRAMDDSVLFVTERPVAQIAERLQRLYNVGVRDFYLKFWAHGNTRGIALGNTTLKPEELEWLMLKKFPDCRFTLDGDMCYGGGLHGLMDSFEDHKNAEPGRVTAIVQGKPTTMHYARGTWVDGRLYFATPFEASMLDSLLTAPPGTTFGAMIRKADAFGKKTSTNDAGVWRSRPRKPSEYTAGRERPPAGA